ncbi:hypothetical protein CQ019_07885 [Arthrobacter sp. MYb229]|nr:hypothetical protein CQ019_07885 [Arthrobacter sp. MYb229]PRB51840.1 hypothetical protein CQ013_08695 [Arthrobacter sp. MYb216]
MSVSKEEIIGPELADTKFSDEDSRTVVLRQAFGNGCGLNSIIFTRGISEALLIAKKIQAGNLRVNTGAGMDANMPSGGFKQSGWGMERAPATRTARIKP